MIWGIWGFLLLLSAIPAVFGSWWLCSWLLRRPDGSDGHGETDQSEGNAGNRAPGVLDEARRQVPFPEHLYARPRLKPGSKPPVLVSTPPERTELFEREDS